MTKYDKETLRVLWEMTYKKYFIWKNIVGNKKEE